MRILGASGIDERLGRCVQVDAGVVQQVDQLNDHDRRQAPDLVLAKTIAGHVPTAALVVDAVSVLARILAKELQRYAEHRSDLGIVGPVFDVIRNHPRSEEHTSELQSLMRISYAVFCLKTT